MKCIITGCALVASDGGWVAGDLFETAGGDYIFNGNWHGVGDAAWFEGEPHYEKRIHPADWWVRRGVFVIDRLDCSFNEAAKEYIRG